VDNFSPAMYINFVTDLGAHGSLRNYIRQVDTAIPALSNDLKAAKLLEKVQAYNFARTALGTGSVKAVSGDILDIITKHLDDVDFMRIVGGNDIGKGKEAFGELIKKYIGKCEACTVTNPNIKLPETPKEFFDKVVELTKRYSDKNGIDIFNEAKKALYSQEGIWHAMKHIDGLDPDIVKRLDAKFEGEGLPCEGCRFDVELFPNPPVSILKLIEYKSYLDASKIPLKQFKNYLNDVASLDEFKYIFSLDKLDLPGAQNGMKNFLNNKADELFKTEAQGGLGIVKMRELFNIPGININNANHFKTLLTNNAQFRAHALSFVDIF